MTEFDEQTSFFAYTRSGHPGKPRILFLHGFMGSKDDWSEVAGYLEDTADCLLVDLPGHGETKSADDRDFIMPGCAEQLRILLGGLNFLPCHVVGYSMGGRLGLYLLLKYPKSFTSGLLESASPGLETADKRAGRIQLDQKRAEDLEHSSLTFFLNDWYAQPMFHGMKKRLSTFEELLQRRLKSNKEGWVKSLRLMGTGHQPSLWDELNRLKQKVHLIVGSSDSKFRSIAEEMATASTKFEVRTIAGCGHNIHFEAPEKFVTELNSFFEL